MIITDSDEGWTEVVEVSESDNVTASKTRTNVDKCRDLTRELAWIDEVVLL